MDWVLREPAEIGRYLTALRDQDRAALAASADAVALAALLDAHTVAMAHDGAEPIEESLATWLSLLDHAEWRERVRAVRVELGYLTGPELDLFARVREDAGARVLAG